MSFLSRYLEPAFIERLNHLQLSARRVVEGATTGLHRSPLKGASVEFRQHRFYVPGDEPRRLDWRVLGRTNRLYIKEYDEETNLRCALLLDASGSMAYGGAKPDRKAKPQTKFDHACQLSAALAYLMLAHTESVGIGVMAPALRQWLAPRSGSGQLARILGMLEEQAPSGASNLAGSLHNAAERLERRALVVIISDFFAAPAGIRQGLAHLIYDGHEVIALQVLHPDEITFPFAGVCRLRGLESERPQVCEAGLARVNYLENFRRHTSALQEMCRTLGIELRRFVTDKPLMEQLTSFLNRRMR